MANYEATLKDGGNDLIPGRHISFGQKLKYSARIRRVEFIPVGLTVILFPALLAAATLDDLASLNFALALVTVFLTMHVANLVNCYVDRDLDVIYKGRLSEAVHALGGTNIKRQIVATCLLIAVLVGLLLQTTQRFDIAIIALVQLFLAFQYTTRPLFLKGAGLWQIPALFMLMFFGAGLLVVRSTQESMTPWTLAGMAGFGTAMMGIVLLNTTEDYPEDREFGVRTSARVLGITGAMAVGAGLLAGGLTVSLASIYQMKFTWATTIPMIASALPVLFALLGACARVYRQPEDIAMPIVRRHAQRVPIYLALFGWGSVASALVNLAI